LLQLEVPAACKVGEMVTFKGVEAKPDAPLSSKHFNKLLKVQDLKDGYLLREGI